MHCKKGTPGCFKGECRLNSKKLLPDKTCEAFTGCGDGIKQGKEECEDTDLESWMSIESKECNS